MKKVPDYENIRLSNSYSLAQFYYIELHFNIKIIIL